MIFRIFHRRPHVLRSVSQRTWLIGELKYKAVVVCKKETGVYTSTFPSWRDRFREAYLEEDRHFIDCIINDKEPIASGEDGKAALEAVLAATKSIKEGRPVTLPLKL